MGMDFVFGDKEVARYFRALPDGIRSRVSDSIGRLTLALQRSVKMDKLSGQVLKVRTGTLRRSVDQRLVTDGSTISGIVSTNVEYGKLHEYGFTGDVSIKAHLRRSKAQMKMAIIGKKGFELKKSKEKWAGKGDVMVKEHMRHVDLPERSFLRSALADMKGDIVKALDKAVADSINHK